MGALLITIPVLGVLGAVGGAVWEHRRGVGREYGMVSLAARLWAWEQIMGPITVILWFLVAFAWARR
jgi:hypothetical protein